MFLILVNIHLTAETPNLGAHIQSVHSPVRLIDNFEVYLKTH